MIYEIHAIYTRPFQIFNQWTDFKIRPLWAHIGQGGYSKLYYRVDCFKGTHTKGGIVVNIEVTPH